jgi:hypothetical protein
MTSGSWLGPRLWSSLARHAIPVAGVLFLGWGALDFLLFLVLETWLFITLRMGVEATLSPAMGKVPPTTAGKIGELALMLVMSGAVVGLVLGLVCVLVRQFAFRDADWQRFLEAAVWTTPAFRIALLLLLLDLAWDAGRFAIRVASRPAPDLADDLQLQRVVMRVTVLAAAGVAAGLSPFSSGGGRAIVVALAAAMVLLDAWPDDAVDQPEDPAAASAAATAPSPASVADAGAGAPRRSRRRRGRSRRG